MAEITLVTGGCRSGKSRYAREIAESLPGPRVFVATCPLLDDEMRTRIDRHRQEREAAGWDTIEETTDLAGTIRGAADYDVILVDCLTLWVNNLMYEAGEQDRELTEDDMVEQANRLLEACGQRHGTVLFVTNEVGMSIVPENALARRYRDLIGRCNQTIAAHSDVVALVSCGIPLELKRRKETQP